MDGSPQLVQFCGRFGWILKLIILSWMDGARGVDSIAPSFDRCASAPSSSPAFIDVCRHRFWAKLGRHLNTVLPPS
ncbi:hypothetical protein [Pseudorhodoplanes sinuspersici]|uniref:Uncharacterized protein n=1 Tax=Pseudorhodoplanes sinuspersici TaxID=1235591 RepID=A0A1W6ZKD2_9HYPH|nr:hypothetical protein [Pseudorhodoplanes sinuspersici]ARP97868.1 hypothetical protein CAK95_01305 [Pseudorhodoplanes sinuspersici]